jgi:hypothetical protein
VRWVSAAENPSSISLTKLVRESVYNEVNSDQESGRRFMFRDQKNSLHLSQTKLLVETNEAMAGMLIARDGHPLNAQERQQELDRLENYVKNPDELTKKRKQEKEDADRTERILAALPDAFLYEPDGTVAGTASVGREGDQLVRLKFRPNPDYNPPTRTEQVLTGMWGHLLIDATEKRVAEIDAVLQKDVGFGWGILGHLDRGGHFLVQQADVGGHHWEVTRMDLAFTGKILLFKKLNIRSVDVFSDFQPVPSNLTFAQGVELLKKESSGGEPQSAKRESERRRPDRATRASEQAGEQLCCDR